MDKIALARHVWPVVTAHPHATVRELATLCHIPWGRCQVALRTLADAGYIVIDARRARARRIILPCGVQR
jgi:hypothetical protein